MEQAGEKVRGRRAEEVQRAEPEAKAERVESAQRKRASTQCAAGSMGCGRRKGEIVRDYL